jgi:hypothetical protein
MTTTPGPGLPNQRIARTVRRVLGLVLLPVGVPMVILGFTGRGRPLP